MKEFSISLKKRSDISTSHESTSGGSSQANQQYATDDLPNASNSAPIRIYPDYSYFGANDPDTCATVGQQITAYDPAQGSVKYTCEAADILTDATKDYLLNTLVPQAIATLENALAVVPVQGNLFLSETSCALTVGGIRVPSNYVTEGVANADVVVFITVRPIVSASILAFGGECQWDQFYRPVAGQLNLNPSAISTAAGMHAMQLGTVTHEHSHLLGFSFNNFQILRGPGSTPYSAINQTLSYHLAGNEPTQIYRFTGTYVKSFVQYYFGCQDLEGADLEDNGASGTALSHWKKRVFNNEYMTGEATNNPVFSDLTLAMFQDSGWYSVNFSASQPLLWGFNMGCDFVNYSCASWPTGGAYFCNSDGATSCSFDLASKSYCSLATSAIPQDYQYFGSASQGGDDVLSDYCPIVAGYSNGWCTDPANAPTGDSAVVDTGETYCPTCRCYMSTLVKDLPGVDSRTMTCYNSSCASESLLKVQVGDFWYDCTQEGDPLDAIDFGGTLTCPSPAQICGQAPYDPNWPTFTSIVPPSGEPGAWVTIYGTGFKVDDIVYMSGYCPEVEVINSTTIIAQTPDYQDIDAYSSLLTSEVYVVIIDTAGRTVAVRDAYQFHIILDANLANGALLWVKAHWYVVVIAGIVLILVILFCYCCCCKKKKENMY